MKAINSNLVSAVDVVRQISRARWIDVLLVVSGSLLVSLAAQVRVPVPGTDVPMTLQLLAVLLIGYVMSPVCAASSMFLYVLFGVAGLPVFAGPAGLLGPTGGYILAFVPAAFLVSFLSGERDAGVGRMLLAGLCGTAVVFAMGIAWRVVVFGVFGIGDEVAWLSVASGVVPFAGKAAVELALAVMLARSVRCGFRGRR